MADEPTAAVLQRAGGSAVRVRSPRPDDLAALPARDGVSLSSPERGLVEVQGLSAAEIGDRAVRAGVALHELTPVTASLEEAFMDLTRDDREYRTDDRQEALV